MKWWAGSLQIAISPAKFWNRPLSTDHDDQKVEVLILESTPLPIMSNGGDRDSRLSTKWAPPTSLIPKKNEAGNSWKFNSTKWFGYPSISAKSQNHRLFTKWWNQVFSTKRLGFYDLQGSRLLSFTQKTVKKNICSEHESYQMVEDMATPIPHLVFIFLESYWPFAKWSFPQLPWLFPPSPSLWRRSRRSWESTCQQWRCNMVVPR